MFLLKHLMHFPPGIVLVASHEFGCAIYVCPCMCVHICVCVCVYNSWPRCVACRTLVPRGMAPMPPGLGAPSLNNWTAREVPVIF